MKDQKRTRVDLHCHSHASALAGPRRPPAQSLPECATSPAELYELAKRRGMDFVTITDHDTIAGALRIADRPDAFVSEELTAWFKGEPQAVHVLCFGITPDDHAWLQAHSRDVVACAAYLHEHEIACALAHPFFHVAAPLTAAHRRALAELFTVWETRNGLLAPELNAPAAIYVETHGGTAVGGSDDHAGIDIGRTWTEAPAARTPAELLSHLRAGRVTPAGGQGSVAKWAHASVALAARVLGTEPDGQGAEEEAALRLAERLLRDRGRRAVADLAGLAPEDARALLRAWIAALGLDAAESERAGTSERAGAVLAALQADGFDHGDLERRARRIHERRLAVTTAAGADVAGVPGAAGLITACMPAIPYIPAAALMSRERSMLSGRDGDPPRVAVVADAAGALPGVASLVAQLRERDVPGYEVEVIGADRSVDRRLTAVAEAELPFLPGAAIGVPSMFSLAEALSERPYDLLHVCAPGPAGAMAVLIGDAIGLPVVGSCPPELHQWLDRAGAAGADARAAAGALYRGCDVVLSPGPAADEALRALGVATERIGRWERGVELERFSPARYAPGELDADRFNVLHVGRLGGAEIDVLAEAFLIARDREPRLHLVLAGAGPAEAPLRRRLGRGATFLGWVPGDRLARLYASADLLMFAGSAGSSGQAILEAQASGLPVLAARSTAAADLIDDGRTGCLAPAEPATLATALRSLARHAGVRDRLATGGLLAVRGRSVSRSLEQLADGYHRAAFGGHAGEDRRAA